MEVRQRRERGCGLFLSCENQIFLKLPRQWLAEKAATAMTGRVHRRLHTQFNPSQTAWHPINQAFISMDPKKLYFHSPASNWAKARPLLANSGDGGPRPDRAAGSHHLHGSRVDAPSPCRSVGLQQRFTNAHSRDLRKFLTAARARQHISATLVSLK